MNRTRPFVTRTSTVLMVLVLLVGVAATAGPARSRSANPDRPDAPDYELADGRRLPSSVWLEDLTWPEIDRAIATGATTIIVPTGGTEQNGPHMVTGKHNQIVAEVAERVAERRGDTLVAPVLAYVPEGDPETGSGHTRFPGTISIPEPVFEDVLEATATSLRYAGFTTIAFLGDSGWNQEPQDRVADRLGDRWEGDGVQVLNLRSAYDPEENGEHDLLRAVGLTEEQIGLHAGPRDTAEALAANDAMVREDLIAENGGGDPADTGVTGDPTWASESLGRQLLRLKATAALQALEQAGGP